MAMKTRIYHDNRYDMYRKAGKQVLNTIKCEVLVLPVHLRETRFDHQMLYFLVYFAVSEVVDGLTDQSVDLCMKDLLFIIKSLRLLIN